MELTYSKYIIGFQSWFYAVEPALRTVYKEFTAYFDSLEDFAVEIFFELY